MDHISGLKSGVWLYKIFKYSNLLLSVNPVINLCLGDSNPNNYLFIASIIGSGFSWYCEQDFKKDLLKAYEKKEKTAEKVYDYIQECKSENKSFHKSDLEAVLK